MFARQRNIGFDGGFHLWRLVPYKAFKQGDATVSRARTMQVFTGQYAEGEW
ncbi:hypothetical protein D3C81_2341170 [compost metagenome]